MITQPHRTGREQTFETEGGIVIHRISEETPYADATASIVAALDERRGVLLASSFEYPGRYTRWDVGFVDPPVEFSCRDRRFRFQALNARGRILLAPLAEAAKAAEAVRSVTVMDDRVDGEISPPAGPFTEEERSRQPSVFSLLRAVIAAFASPADPHLGFYGAFGYDLAFQFEAIRRRLPRDVDQRDLVVFLPDEILLVDHRRQSAVLHRYDFEVDGRSTAGLARDGGRTPFVPAERVARQCDHETGEYARIVRVAREAFRRGDMFEVVPGQTFFEPCPAPPSEIFTRLKARNPAPYGALMNLGEGEYLVAASPEMYVRVDGRRIETCPISGTIARGKDAIGDAAQIQTLLNSEKDAAELTMCTDVDRNDKSRVCEPGSVRVIGRRQIEMYSRLIHTVDHVEGRLRAGFDALDGFLAHAWAVTVTGAPKRAAMQFIEDHEHSARRFYGGAIGFVGFDGGMNTGLTLRTVHIRDGVAQVRAGATLLFDSDPDSEEAETRLKASALLDAIRRADAPAAPPAAAPDPGPGAGCRVLMVDHQDSFVHTLAAYLRETGAEVVTLRAGFPLERLAEIAPDAIVLSPGPGRPGDHAMRALIAAALAEGLPIFGVCLGLQGIAEFFGARLATLPEPMHGKPSKVRNLGGWLLDGLPRKFPAGRYHSLHAVRDTLPSDLVVTAETRDGTVMAIEHARLPVAAVQFHPESILTLSDDHGRRLIANVIARFAAEKGDVERRESCRRQPALALSPTGAMP